MKKTVLYVVTAGVAALVLFLFLQPPLGPQGGLGLRPTLRERESASSASLEDDLESSLDEEIGMRKVLGEEPTAPASTSTERDEVQTVPEGLLIRARASGMPRAGLQAFVGINRSTYMTRSPLGQSDKVTRHQLGSDGTTRVEGLPAGTHLVALEVQHGVTAQFQARVDDDGRGLVDLQEGTARIFGTVTRDDGTAADDALVLAFLDSRNAPVWVTHADGIGAFTLLDLPAGHYSLEVYFDGVLPLGADDSAEIELPDGQTANVQFGKSITGATFSGRILTLAGEALAPSSPLPGHVTLTATDGRAPVQLDLLPGGHFESRLRPGEFSLRVRLPGRRYEVDIAARIEIGHAGAEDEWIALGATLRCSVAGGAPPPPNGQRRANLVAKRDGAPRRQSIIMPIGKDGVARFDGLEPGAWTITHALDPNDTGVRVEVRAEDSQLTCSIHAPAR